MSTMALISKIDEIIGDIDVGIRELDETGLLIEMESSRVEEEFDAGDEDFKDALKKVKIAVEESGGNLKEVKRSLENVMQALRG